MNKGLAGYGVANIDRYGKTVTITGLLSTYGLFSASGGGGNGGNSYDTLEALYYNVASLLKFDDTNLTDEKGHTWITSGGVTTTVDGQFNDAIVLDGVNSRLVGPDREVFDISATNFTVDFWLKDIEDGGCVFQFAEARYAAMVGFAENGELKFYASSGGTSWDIADGYSMGAAPGGVWTHYALTRENNIFRAFRNGIQVGTDLESTLDIYMPDGNPQIGAALLPSALVSYGSMTLDEFRITNGAARYTEDFTPPTTSANTPQNVVDTSFANVTSLLQFDNSLDDAIETNLWTASGGVTTDGDPAHYGKSMYLDGIASFITLDTSKEVVNFSSKNFTLEFFYKCVTLKAASLVSTANNTTDGYWSLQHDANGKLFLRNTGTDTWLTSSNGVITTDLWQHIVLQRTGNSLRCFVNGQTVMVNENIAHIFTKPDVLQIGCFANDVTKYAHGYFDDFRITRDVARYAGTSFTPPSVPFSLSGPPFTGQTVSHLHFDGNLIDEAGNVWTATHGTNAAQGRFKPTGLTLYGNNSQGYLSTPFQSGFKMDDNVPFTVECWFRINTLAEIQHVFTIGANPNASSYAGMVLQINGGALLWYVSTSGSSWPISGQSLQTLDTNTWYHVAVTRDASGTIRAYVNGVMKRQYAGYGSIYSGNAPVLLGALYYAIPYELCGNIDEFRFTRGYARYTGTTYNVPTEPSITFQAPESYSRSDLYFASITSQLSFESLTDAQGNVWTPFGSATITTTGARYSGKKVLTLDGVNSYVTTPEGFYFEGRPFTVEFWVYRVDDSTAAMVCLGTNVNDNGYCGVNITQQNGSLFTYFSTDGTTWLFSVGSNGTKTPLNQWAHVAICKDENGVRQYINGVATAGGNSYAGALYQGTGASRIGGYSGFHFNGRIDDLRITKGAARYVDNFVPLQKFPAALTYSLDSKYNNIESLLKFEGNLNDYKENEWITVGNANTTGAGRFGGNALTLDGIDSLIAHNHNGNFDFGSGDFTIECWIKKFAGSLEPIIAKTYYYESRGWALFNWNGINAGGGGAVSRKLTFSANNGQFQLTTANDVFAENTWTHIAVTRSGNTFRIFANGTLVAQGTYADPILHDARATYIGGFPPGVWYGPLYYNGLIDEVRITKGVARYIENFTPSTATFPVNDYVPADFPSNAIVATPFNGDYLDILGNTWHIVPNNGSLGFVANPFGRQGVSGTNMAQMFSYSENYDPAGGPFTFDMLLKITNPWMGDITLYGAAGILFTFRLSVSGRTTLQWYNGTSTSYSDDYNTPPNMTVSDWNHWSVVYDPAAPVENFRVYCNGVKKHTASGALGARVADILLIGTYSGEWIAWSISEFVYTKAALHNADFTSPTESILGALPEGDNSFNKVTSLLTFDNGFTDKKGFTWTPANVNYARVQQPKSGLGSLAGNNYGALTTPFNSSINLSDGSTTPFTIEFYYLPLSIGGVGWTRQVASINGFQLVVDRFNDVSLFYNGFSFNQKLTYDMATWDHICLQYDGDQMCLYINGVPGNGRQSVGNLLTNNTDGISLMSANFGFIDNFKITRGDIRYSMDRFLPPPRIVN